MGSDLLGWAFAPSCRRNPATNEIAALSILPPQTSLSLALSLLQTDRNEINEIPSCHGDGLQHPLPLPVLVS